MKSFNNFHIVIRQRGTTPKIWDRQSRRWVDEQSLTPATVKRCTYPTVQGCLAAFTRKVYHTNTGGNLEAGQLHLPQMGAQ